MKPYLNSEIGRTILTVLGGAVFGSIGSVVFAALCPGLYWEGLEIAPFSHFVIGLGTTGAIVGALLGLLVAIDQEAQRKDTMR